VHCSPSQSEKRKLKNHEKALGNNNVSKKYYRINENGINEAVVIGLVESCMAGYSAGHLRL